MSQPRNSISDRAPDPAAAALQALKLELQLLAIALDHLIAELRRPRTIGELLSGGSSR